MTRDPDAMRRAANAAAYAIGSRGPNGFRVRKVVWGRLLARTERREGEELRRAIILVRGRRG